MRFKPEGLSANAWAVSAGVSRTVWADMRRHGNPSRRTLERLLAAAGSSLAEFEALRVGHSPTPRGAVGSGLSDATRAWGRAPMAPLPLAYSAAGGQWPDAEGPAEIVLVDRSRGIEFLPRPPSLAHDLDAFALTITHDAMWPRFREGARVAVSPRTPVTNGDDVLVLLHSRFARPAGDAALVMRLVGQDRAGVELRQFQPDRSFTVDGADVAAVMRIAGELF